MKKLEKKTEHEKAIKEAREEIKEANRKNRKFKLLKTLSEGEGGVFDTFTSKQSAKDEKRRELYSNIKE